MCVLRILTARAPAGVFKPLFDKVKFWIKFLFKITLDNNSRHWQKAQTKVGGWSGQCKCSLWESPSFPRPRPLLHLHHHHIHPGHFSTSINTSSTPLLRHPPSFCTRGPLSEKPQHNLLAVCSTALQNFFEVSDLLPPSATCIRVLGHHVH